jgi:hypothetical protein
MVTMAVLVQNKGKYSIILSKRMGEYKYNLHIPIGKMTKIEANKFKTMLGRYIRAKQNRILLPTAIAEWQNSLPGRIKKHLIAIGDFAYHSRMPLPATKKKLRGKPIVSIDETTVAIRRRRAYFLKLKNCV